MLVSGYTERWLRRLGTAEDGSIGCVKSAYSAVSREDDRSPTPRRRGWAPLTSLLGARLRELSQQLRRPEELVRAEITHRLDVERLPEQVGITLADPLQRADRRLEDLGQGLALPLLVEERIEVGFHRHVGLR